MAVEHDIPPIAEELAIDDLEVLRKLANPLRLRLLALFREPRSIAEVAQQMDVPPTRLYYHVNMLADAGVLAVVATRKRGAQLEKVYRIVAHSIRPSDDILRAPQADPEAFAEVAASLILDSARAELTSSLAHHARTGFDPSKVIGSLGRTLVNLTPEQAELWARRMQEFAVEIKAADTDEGSEMYGFTYSFFPLDPPTSEATT